MKLTNGIYFFIILYLYIIYIIIYIIYKANLRATAAPLVFTKWTRVPAYPRHVKTGHYEWYGRIYQILNENLIESAGLSIRLFLRISEITVFDSICSQDFILHFNTSKIIRGKYVKTLGLHYYFLYLCIVNQKKARKVFERHVRIINFIILG